MCHGELLALGLEAGVVAVDSDWVLLFLVDFCGFSDSKLEMGWITGGSNGHSVSLSSSFDTGKYAGVVELSNIGVGGWVRALPDGPDLVGCNFDSIHSWVAFWMSLLKSTSSSLSLTQTSARVFLCPRAELRN